MAVKEAFAAVMLSLVPRVTHPLALSAGCGSLQLVPTMPLHGGRGCAATVKLGRCGYPQVK